MSDPILGVISPRKILNDPKALETQNNKSTGEILSTRVSGSACIWEQGTTQRAMIVFVNFGKSCKPYFF